MSGPLRNVQKRNGPPDFRHRLDRNYPQPTSRRAATRLSRRIRAGAIFSSCSFKSFANSTGASALRIGISPSELADPP